MLDHNITPVAEVKQAKINSMHQQNSTNETIGRYCNSPTDQMNATFFQNTVSNQNRQ